VSSAAEHPFDAGLQPERTALAWRRTGLALGAGALVGVRVLPEILGVWAIVPAGIGIVLAAAVIGLSHHRYRRHHVTLAGGHDPARLPGGGLAALTAITTLLFGVAALVIALVFAH
jgi:putative membrane protein